MPGETVLWLTFLGPVRALQQSLSNEADGGHLTVKYLLSLCR